MQKNRSFRLTHRAEMDLLSIGRYTEINWDKNQRNNYLRDLNERFSWLAKTPEVGKHRPKVKDGYYSFQQGSHLIFYLIREEFIDIIGIVHKSMDSENYLM